MKFAKLLVLSALWLTASSAVAAIADNVRQKPAITATQGFEASESIDTYYYLYNVGAQAFFTQGNAWGTQASIGSTGIKVAFTLDGSAYLFNDYPPTKGNWMLCFFDTETAMYVDRGSQANYHWGVEQGNGTFRLYAASDADGNPGWADTTDETTGEVTAHPAYREGQYMGLDASTGGTALSPYLTEADNHYIDWAFVTEAVYDEYAAQVGVYEASETLKATLEEGEALGANIATALAVYTNAASTADELKAANDALKTIIDARKPLKTALDNAKERGFTETAAYDAVYNNGDATAAELKKALEDLNAALVEWGKSNASVEHPADMTAKIVNPNFDNASYSGWSGDAPNMVGSGSHGPANVPEKWNATFNTYQDITELPAGVYALGCQTFWRGSYTDMQKKIGPAAKLYAVAGEKESSVPFNYAYAPLNTEQLGGSTSWGVNAGETSATDSETGITYYIPNDPSAFRVYAEKGMYDTKLLFGLNEGETLRIGTKNPSMMGDADNWSVWDTFTLTYYGSGADAAKLYLDETIKNYSEMTLEEGTVYTESYLTAYNEALKQEISVSSFADVATALGGIEEAKEAVEKNIDLWKEWQAEVVKAGEYVANPDYESDQLADYVGVLGDYYDMEQEEILAAKALTNEELQAEIDKIEAAITALLDAYKTMLKDGDDVTRFITNPTFEKNNKENTGNHDGWTVTRVEGGNVTEGPIGGAGDTFLDLCGYYNSAFESWHCHDWDVWQEIKDLPKGMYELNVQGYVRCEVNGYTRGNDLSEFPSPVYLYMNSATAQFPNVYSQVPAEYGVDFQIIEGWTTETINDNLYPNSMGGAAQCFNNPELYKMTAYGLIAKPGDTFRIGVRMKADQDWWCIWDNFKLTYREPSFDIVKPALDEAMKTIDTSEAMGSEVYSLAEKVINDANTAVANADANEMFDALSAIYDAADSIRTSVSKFKELTDAHGNLGAALDRAAVASIKAEGEALYGKIQSGIDNHEYETSQVDDLLGEIAVMINRLGTPADMDQASDVNPIECTGMIINPAYVDGTDEGWTGGAALSATACDAEKFSTNYDYYQLIQGLPEGTYQVTLSAYFRAGNAADDYKAYVANPDSLNNAFLYAVGEGDTCSVAIKRLASEPVQLTADDELMSEWVWCSEENRLTVPNSMTTAGDIFQTPNEATGKNYFADNRVTVKVGADGKLTIGLKKNVKITDDWTIWTNWQLFYLGKNSALTPDSDASGISEASSDAAVKVEYFSLGGQKTNGNGLVIKKETMSDGSVKSTVILK